MNFCSIVLFSNIITSARLLTGYIHNTKHKMPAILPKENEKDWLNPLLSKEDISSLLVPFEANLMDAYVICNDFLRKRADDPSILDKVG